MSDVPASPSSAPAATPSTPSTPAPAQAAAAKTPNAKSAALKGDATTASKPTTAADKLAGTAPKTEKPAAPEATAAEKAEAAKRKYKLKVHGQEKEVELSDDEIAVRLQKDEAAEVRLAKAAEAEKKLKAREAELEDQLGRFKKLLREDPDAAAKLFDPEAKLEEIYERKLAEKYRRETMTEEQRKALELQEKVEAYEREAAERKAAEESKIKETKEAEAKRVQAEHDQKLLEETQATWVEALNQSDLEKSKRTLFLMAQISKQNLEHGVELTPQQVAQEVRRTLESDVKTVMGTLKGEKLAKFLGDATVKEVQRYIVEKARSSLKPTQKNVSSESKTDTDDEPLKKAARTSRTEWRKFVRE